MLKMSNDAFKKRCMPAYGRSSTVMRTARLLCLMRQGEAASTCVGVRHPPGWGRGFAARRAGIVAEAGGPHVHGGLQLRLPHVRLRKQEQRQRVRIHRLRRQPICIRHTQPVSCK